MVKGAVLLYRYYYLIKVYKLGLGNICKQRLIINLTGQVVCGNYFTSNLSVIRHLFNYNNLAVGNKQTCNALIFLKQCVKVLLEALTRE